MLNSATKLVIKQSVLSGYILSQPLAVNVDAYPALQNKEPSDAVQIQYNIHPKAVRILSYQTTNLENQQEIWAESAVKQFQQGHNLPVAKQNSKKKIQTLTEAEQQRYLEQIQNGAKRIHPGMRHKEVKVVQNALHYFGYYDGAIDGIYGPLTYKALQTAERKQHVRLLDDRAKEKLMELYGPDKPLHTKSTNNSQNKTKTTTTYIKVKTNTSPALVKMAMSFIGTPYKWGGESPDGFDCSGFIQYVFQSQDIVIPRTVSDIWNFTKPIEKPAVGDLVFFETYKPGPSHTGIYIGDGRFIHAGLSHGVTISKLSNSYWKSTYIGAKRIQ